MGRLVGLDSIRIICAVAVAAYHVGVLPGPTGGGSRAYDLAWRGSRAAIEGQAAVIVFFVASGLCIHWPYRSGAAPDVGRFYARRFARILPPMAAAVALGMAMGSPLDALGDSILWSLWAECFYYAAYPALLAARRRIGWGLPIAISYGIAYAIVAAKGQGSGNFPSFGVGLNWLVGLPCWLLGCRLAETIGNFAAPGRMPLWAWRAAVVLAGAAAMRLRFDAGVGLPWTLPFFAALACAWMGRELAHLADSPPPAWLERAGRGSYSLYLTHTIGYGIGWRLSAGGPGTLARHALSWAVLAALAWAFYRTVEAPSHRLSRSLFARPPGDGVS